MRKLIYLIALAALFLGLAADANSQSPTPTPPNPGGASCSNPSREKGLVAVIPGDIEVLQLLNNPLCTPSENWGFTPFHFRAIGVVGEYGFGRYRFIPVVKSSANLTAYCDEWGDYSGPNYEDAVIFGFWPSVPTSQGGTFKTAEQTGKLAADILDCTPDRKLIGPFHHTSFVTGGGIPSDWMERFYDSFIANGGSAGDITAWGFTFYPSAFAGNTPAQLISLYEDQFEDTGINRHVWALEVEWSNNYSQPYNHGKKLMNDVMNLSLVDKAFGYNVFGLAPNHTDFYSPTITQSNLTSWGAGYRDSGW